MNLNHALSVRSDFSVGNSLLQVDHIIEEAKKHGYESVALVDDMSVSNMVDFSNKCKKAGIKPIIGCRLRVVDDPTYRTPAKNSGEEAKPNPLVMLKAYAIDDTGIKSLIKALSKGNTPEYFYYQSRIGWEEMLGLEGVIVTTGDFYNLFTHPEYDHRLNHLTMKFGERLYVELTPVDTPLFDTLNARALQALELSRKMGAAARPIASYPFMYRNDTDADTLEVMAAISNPMIKSMSDPWRAQQYVRDFGFKGPTSIAKRVTAAHGRIVKWNGINAGHVWKQALANIEKIAAACTYEFKKLPVSLPKMADDEFAALGRKCIDGWKRRFTQPILGYVPDPADIPKYQARLKYELSVLKKMGFAGYFLLVEDLVMWSKSNGIIVGPGRGSVGGSLVAYLIGITDVDPIRFNLLFERFINPERLDLPDADLDFMSTRRHEVIEYLRGKYGEDRVAGISNFGTLASASALRDTGRMFELDNSVLAATKLVPKEQGIPKSLTEAADAVNELDNLRRDYPDIWNHALKLEGIVRNFSQHAAGVVVGGEPLSNRAVIETRAGDLPVTNWDKRVVEDWGLVKMDILGLSTLDTLEIARRYVKDRHGIDVSYINLPLEEPDVMAAFAAGDTTGVFQFESSGMRKLLRDLAKGGNLTFEDITAATALYRPGPMESGMLSDFVAIKQGHKLPYYEHPNMEPALAPTYGVVVYQEQVMQLSVDLAGFTGAEADHLRKAMGKKDKDKMAEMREKWVKGCETKSSMDPLIAGDLFDKIEAFAGYGFNRSHSVEYSIISVWTMWMRVRYPAEYFAATLSIVDDEDKIPGLVNDARSCGIEVLPPDINLSSDRFTIPDDKHILAPFSAVKGISETTARRIVELRENNRGIVKVRDKKKRDGTLEPVYDVDKAGPVKGRFDSVEEFEMTAGLAGSKVNSKVVDVLKAVGAMASVDPTALPARHPDRRREQMELMPGLIVDAVKAERETDTKDPFVRQKIIHLVQEYRKCQDCDLAGQLHPAVRTGDRARFMVVEDSPTWQEEKNEKYLVGDAAECIKLAMKENGLSPNAGYYTALVKAKKNDKFLTREQLNGCTGFFRRELELVRPPIIVALGSAAIKHLIPGAKPADLVGKVVYDSKLDASIVCGINPGMIHFDASKQEILNAVFAKVAEILE
jgi:DNA polymerase-3 subunit alpha